MKKFCFALLTAVLLVSCSKELSFEKQCGTVTHIKHRGTIVYITIQYANHAEVLEAGRWSFTQFPIGSTYCK